MCFSEVVVHPLKAYQHYADLSTSNYGDVAEIHEFNDTSDQVYQENYGPVSDDNYDDTQNPEGFPQNHYTSTTNIKTATSAEGNSQLYANTSEEYGPTHNKESNSGDSREGRHSKETSGTSVDESNVTTVVMRNKKKTGSAGHPKKLQESQRSSITYEGSSEDDDESVSVTTGRLSLTLSHSSDNNGAIDVTAATVEKEEVQTELAPRIRTSTSGGGKSHATITKKPGNKPHH